jgi:hypothetical protein
MDHHHHTHCGIQGNEEADKMAKLGAEKEQKNKSVSLPEMKNILKSMLRTPHSKDNYHQLIPHSNNTIDLTPT